MSWPSTSWTSHSQESWTSDSQDSWTSDSQDSQDTQNSQDSQDSSESDSEVQWDEAIPGFASGPRPPYPPAGAPSEIEGLPECISRKFWMSGNWDSMASMVHPWWFLGLHTGPRGGGSRNGRGYAAQEQLSREVGRRTSRRPLRFSADLVRRLVPLPTFPSQGWEGPPDYRQETLHLDQPHQSCVNRLAWSDDGAMLASVSDDTYVSVWDALYSNDKLDTELYGFHSRPRCVTRFPSGHESNVLGVRFLPQSNGRCLVTGARDAQVRFHTPQRGEPSAEVYAAHTSSVQEVEVERGGSPWLFWSASFDGTVRQYDTRVDRQAQDLPSCANVLIEDWSPITSLSINPARPHEISTGYLKKPFVHVFDRRMMSLTQPAGVNPATAARSSSPFFEWCPPHVRCSWRMRFRPLPVTAADQFHQMNGSTYGADSWRYYATCVRFGNRKGQLLCSYQHDHTYKLDLKHREKTVREPCNFSSQEPKSSRRDMIHREASWMRSHDDFWDAYTSPAGLKRARCMRKWASSPFEPRRQRRALPQRLPDVDIGEIGMTTMTPMQNETGITAGFVRQSRYRRIDFYESTRGPEIDREIERRDNPFLRTYRASGLLNRSVVGDVVYALRDLERALEDESNTRIRHRSKWSAHYLRAKGLYMLYQDLVREARKVPREFRHTLTAIVPARALLASHRSLLILASAPYSERDGGDVRRRPRFYIERRLRRLIDSALCDIGIADFVHSSSPESLDEFDTALADASEWRDRPGGTAEQERCENLDVPVKIRREVRSLRSLWVNRKPGEYADPSLHPLSRAEKRELDAMNAGTSSGTESDSSHSFQETKFVTAQEKFSNARGDFHYFRHPGWGVMGGLPGPIPPPPSFPFQGLDDDGVSLLDFYDTRHDSIHNAAVSDFVQEMWNQDEACSATRYLGQMNKMTSIKESSFLGEDDELVACCSDTGHVLIFDANTAEILNVLLADSECANCVVSHPFQPLIATSGLDPFVRFWAPGRSPAYDSHGNYVSSPIDGILDTGKGPGTFIHPNSLSFPERPLCDLLIAYGVPCRPAFPEYGWLPRYFDTWRYGYFD